MSPESTPRPRTARRGPGRNRLLTREQVARAAFDLVDAEGGAALTMPRLARELGVGTMTLYGYAESKEEIIGMLPDLLLADIPAPDPELPWPQFVEAVYLSAYQRLVEHEHVTRLIAAEPTFGSAQAGVVEHVLESLERHGFDTTAAFALQRTLGTYTLGFAMFSLAERSDRARTRAAWISEPAERDLFPRTAEITDQLTAPVDDTQFLYGLKTITRGARATTDEVP